MPKPVKHIKLELGDPNVTIAGKNLSNQEAYSLEVDVSRLTIKIIGLTPTAVFYGIQSLLAMMDDKGLESTFLCFKSIISKLFIPAP